MRVFLTSLALTAALAAGCARPTFDRKLSPAELEPRSRVERNPYPVSVGVADRRTPVEPLVVIPPPDEPTAEERKLLGLKEERPHDLLEFYRPASRTPVDFKGSGLRVGREGPRQVSGGTTLPESRVANSSGAARAVQGVDPNSRGVAGASPGRAAVASRGESGSIRVGYDQPARKAGAEKP